MAINQNLLDDPPAPRCPTCSLGREIDGDIVCLASRYSECNRNGFLGHPAVPVVGYCELHPHYPGWALWEANRRLRELAKGGAK